MLKNQIADKNPSVDADQGQLSAPQSNQVSVQGSLGGALKTQVSGLLISDVGQDVKSNIVDLSATRLDEDISKHLASMERKLNGPELALLKPGDLDYFTSFGHRQMALEMLIDSAKVVMLEKDPVQIEQEVKWLTGEGHGPISAEMCFEFIAGYGVDCHAAANNFIRAAHEAPKDLLKSLVQARKRMEEGDFDRQGEPFLFDLDTPSGLRDDSHSYERQSGY
jgi:hypothetical protein